MRRDFFNYYFTNFSMFKTKAEKGKDFYFENGIVTAIQD